MKTTKLLWCALSAIVLAASGLPAWDDEIYDIRAPEDLQECIDTAAAVLIRQQKNAASIKSSDLREDHTKHYPQENMDDAI